MKVDYFKGTSTPAERKARYRELVKVHHPDVGGDVTVMQEIIRQYTNEQPLFFTGNYQHTHADIFSEFRRRKYNRGAYEEVEPDVSYWKANNIDPYADVAAEGLNEEVVNLNFDELMKRMDVHFIKPKEKK